MSFCYVNVLIEMIFEVITMIIVLYDPVEEEEYRYLRVELSAEFYEKAAVLLIVVYSLSQRST
jgi:hypothetical protein